jgi:hypothetical protein
MYKDVIGLPSAESMIAKIKKTAEMVHRFPLRNSIAATWKTADHSDDSPNYHNFTSLLLLAVTARCVFAGAWKGLFFFLQESPIR